LYVFFLPVDRNAYQAADEAQLILADAIAIRERKTKNLSGMYFNYFEDSSKRHYHKGELRVMPG